MTIILFHYLDRIIKNLKNLKITTRVFCQLGTGKNWAPESKLGLAGANNEWK